MINLDEAADCPDSGAWRAWLDHELPLSATIEQHLPGCAACQSLVAELVETAAASSRAVATIAPSRAPSIGEIAAARQHLDTYRRPPVPATLRTPGTRQEPIPMFLSRISTSWRVAASSIAAVVALSLVVAFTPEGNAAAAAFLAQFRSQQVVGVEITPQSQAEIARTLSTLSNLGTVQTPAGFNREGGRPGSLAAAARSVSLSEASQSVGFTLQMPDPATLPTGLNRTPTVQVTPASQIRFTFDKNKARAYYQSIGHPEVSMPDKFDGTALVVSIPSAALLQYGNPGSKDTLLVGQAGELVVDVEGGKASLLELRDFLLGLPGLPESTTAQLRQIQSWNQTLPIPIPVDKVNWQSTTFRGGQGLLLNDNSGIGSAAIWTANGHLYGVAGSLRATDLKRIADGLGTSH